MLLTRRGALGALSAAALTALAACGRDAGAPDPNASSDLEGEIRGAGATSQSDAQDAWMNAFMGANLRATVDYAGGGSGAGRTKLVEGAVDFAGTDTPMTTAEVDRIGGVVELPLYISPIAVAYNLPGLTGQSHVNMTGEVLARVLTGAITRWNDPALAALNPDAALPDRRIIVVGRSDDSGTTKALTTYLATIAPEVWTHDPEETWPLRGGQSGDGTAGMIQTVSAAVGAIGYADASKVPSTLGTVAIGSSDKDGSDKDGSDKSGKKDSDASDKDGSGESDNGDSEKSDQDGSDKSGSGTKDSDSSGRFVSVSADAAAAALDAATLSAEADETRLVYTPSPDADGAYPIVLVSYLVARLSYDDAEIAAIVKAYLRFAASTRGQDTSSKATGCAPITREMREKINAAIDKIEA